MKNWHNFLIEKRKELVYECDLCSGRSQICSCRMKYAEYSAMHSAGIPFSMRKYTRQTLDDISSNDPSIDRMKTLWNKVYDNIMAVRNKGLNLFVYGDSGAGKTMCAAILVREAIKYGFSSRYVTLSSLVNIALNDPVQKDMLMRVDFLIIDDIKRPIEILTDKAILLHASIIDQFFTHRFEAELPTVILSDSTLEEIIETYNLHRIKSSLTSSRTKKILHVGKDYRKDGDVSV